jgi:hypothetical protein
MRQLELTLVTRTQISRHPAWEDDNLGSNLARPLALASALVVTVGVSSFAALVLALFV